MHLQSNPILGYKAPVKCHAFIFLIDMKASRVFSSHHALIFCIKHVNLNNYFFPQKHTYITFDVSYDTVWCHINTRRPGGHLLICHVLYIHIRSGPFSVWSLSVDFFMESNEIRKFEFLFAKSDQDNFRYTHWVDFFMDSNEIWKF